MTHPSIEGRELLDDHRYEGYKAALEERRRMHEAELIRPRCDPRRMDWLAGAITALDWALGKPGEMRDTPTIDPGDPA